MPVEQVLKLTNLYSIIICLYSRLNYLDTSKRTKMFFSRAGLVSSVKCYLFTKFIRILDTVLRKPRQRKFVILKQS